MFRIDHPTAVAVKPAPGAAGTPGYFTEGDPVGGVPATVVTQAWCNSVQEELMSILTAASIAPDKAAANQVLTALQSLFLRTLNFTGSNQLLAGDGFQKLPGGLIVQWGTPLASASGYLTQSFPIAFPNNLFSIVGQSVGNNFPGVEACEILNGTATNFQYGIINASNVFISGRINWIAIGR